MKKYLFFSLVAILASGCSAQDKNKPERTEKNKEISKVEPKGSWKVNKEVDENGNVIRYDSIYSWSSSDDFDHLDPENTDSLNQKFNTLIERFSTRNGKSALPDFFQGDSPFLKDFFQDGFFDDSNIHDHFKNGFSNFYELRNHMDSIRNEFMENHRFQAIPKESGPLPKKSAS